MKWVGYTKEMGAVLDDAYEAGCRIKKKRKGVMILCPDGSTLMIHKTPSARKRAVENTRAELRKALRSG